MESSPSEEQLDLPPQTFPDGIALTLKCFPDDTSGRAFAQDLEPALRLISMFIDLERLDGVTVSYKYAEALGELDRGFQATQPLIPTSNTEMVGVAMAPAVLRNGVVKAHLLFYAPTIISLQKNDESPEWKLAFYLLAHECGHVEGLKWMEQSFPGTALTTFADIEDAILRSKAQLWWDEYAACRLSANFGREQTSAMEQILVSALAVAREQCRAAIREYRLHADISRVIVEAGDPLCEPLKMASYILGHLDGLGQTLDEVRSTRDLINSGPYKAFVERLQPALCDLWETRGHWESIQMFEPLKNIVRDLFADGGMVFYREGGNLGVKIPFTPDTFP